MVVYRNTPGEAIRELPSSLIKRTPFSTHLSVPKSRWDHGVSTLAGYLTLRSAEGSPKPS
jgi:hypothetical protein